MTHAGMSDELAAKIRALGAVIGAPAMNEIYAPIQARQPTDGSNIVRDIIYGPQDRNVLDIYVPASRPAGPMPVLVYFHGGGFRMGDKTEVANFGYYFARAGYVTVLPSYRLAPTHQWPAATEDAAAAVAWVRSNIDAHGGNPQRIFLGGFSAGAAIAADYALTKRMQPAARGLAGLSLNSGVYNVELEMMAANGAFAQSNPIEINRGYFGADPQKYRERSPSLNLGAAKLPVLITYAELDPPQMQVQAGELFAALSRLFGEAPALKVIADHSHISAVRSVNTGDEAQSKPILDFLKAH